MADAEEEARKRLIEYQAERRAEIRTQSRFSIPFIFRLPTATSISFFLGMGLGISHGSQQTGLRFRAENAHRLPTTPTGWYLYHKSKNYHMAYGGVVEGLRMGTKVSIWTAGFFSIEDMFDRYRGTTDFVNTVIASLSVAGAFSLWSMHHLCPIWPLKLIIYRPISSRNSSENGKDRISNGSSIWIGTRCSGDGKREKAGICGVHPTYCTTESRYRGQNNLMIYYIRYRTSSIPYLCVLYPTLPPTMVEIAGSFEQSGATIAVCFGPKIKLLLS